jgi:hypothetical protein
MSPLESAMTLPCSDDSSLGQLVHVRLDQAFELEHHPRAALRIGRGPAVEGGLGGLDRAVHLFVVGQLDPRLNLARVRIEHVGTGPRRPEASAVDEVVDLAHWPRPVRLIPVALI